MAPYVSGGQPTDVADAQFSGHVKFGVNKIKNKKNKMKPAKSSPVFLIKMSV